MALSNLILWIFSFSFFTGWKKLFYPLWKIQQHPYPSNQPSTFLHQKVSHQHTKCDNWKCSPALDKWLPWKKIIELAPRGTERDSYLLKEDKAHVHTVLTTLGEASAIQASCFGTLLSGAPEIFLSGNCTSAFWSRHTGESQIIEKHREGHDVNMKPTVNWADDRSEGG